MSRFNKSKNLEWGSARRPKVSNKLGIPHRGEGSDGDIQIRQTNLGAKLFGKIGGRWNSAFLSSEEEIIGTSGTKIGMDASGSLSVNQIQLEGKISLASKGTQNVCIGTGNSDVSGVEDCISIGVNAGNSLVDGATQDVCIGTNAGKNMTTSDANVCIGYQAGKDITTGASMVVIGTGSVTTSGGAEDATFIGGLNVVIGHQAARAATGSIGGLRNIVLGYLAGSVSGDDNIAMGYNAGNAVTSGHDNISIGVDSDNAATVSDQIAIGDTAITTGQYGIAIGNDISAAGDDCVIGKSGNTITCDFDADGTWTQSSDVRRKRNIKDDTLGLSFINDLKTKTFQWKPAEEYPEEWHAWKDLKDEDGNLTGEKEYSDINTDATMHGLIAQEVKEALDNAGCSTFGGWKLREDGQQEIGKAAFVLPLIKAVQELSAKVDSMQEEINNL